MSEGVLSSVEIGKNNKARSGRGNEGAVCGRPVTPDQEILEPSSTLRRLRRFFMLTHDPRFEIYDLAVEINSVIEHDANGLILVPDKENVILT